MQPELTRLLPFPRVSQTCVSHSILHGDPAPEKLVMLTGLEVLLIHLQRMSIKVHALELRPDRTWLRHAISPSLPLLVTPCCRNMHRNQGTSGTNFLQLSGEKKKKNRIIFPELKTLY